MPIYIMLTTLTEEGRKTVKSNPERIKEVNKEVEAMGVKILSQYAVLGLYDFINILDAPNNEAVSRVAIELGSRGTLKTMTMPAHKIHEVVDFVSWHGHGLESAPGAQLYSNPAYCLIVGGI